ncbi:MAG: putative ATPase, partial [Candidatus Azotimanducaceae bacterium]
MTVSRTVQDAILKGPLDHYQLAIALGEIQPDDAQADAVAHLQRLYEALVDSHPAPRAGRDS